MTQSFFIVHENDDENTLKRVSLLSEAAITRGVDPVTLCARYLDFANLPEPKRGDLLFNCARGGLHLETLLLKPGVASLWTLQSHAPQSNLDTTLHTAVHDRMGLPGPKTIHYLPDDEARLARYVEVLGGFPLVIKVRGGSVGLGVIKCADWQSLLTTVEFLNVRKEKAILREYIPSDKVYRLVFVGDKLACCIIHPNRKGDFRSAIDGTYDIMENPPSRIEELGLKAAKACGYAFVGVDIIDHATRGPLVLEANPPANFTTIKENTGVDIAALIVDYLLTRANTSRLLGSVNPEQWGRYAERGVP